MHASQIPLGSTLL